ncbi:hypothetical protein NDU88_003809 [Pleurodeles waltl]|uniref:Uncharacterized protein n=1 Tax=Pleurodeles waltl TaxID=8319 RepID=A0AAV7NHQ9_PLEWA|nr:hypothetical protein NDU88_003809 [Pleurodeles waltl]
MLMGAERQDEATNIFCIAFQSKYCKTTSLQKYLEVDRVPMGLRIYTALFYENPDPKLPEEWAEYKTASTKGMVKMLVIYAVSDAKKFLQEIKRIEEEIALNPDKTVAEDFHKQMKLRFIAYEEKIKQVKKITFAWGGHDC